MVAFNQPARLALVPSLVPRADLGAAVAINSVIFNLARFVGPMLAGLAILWSGVATAFAANALELSGIHGGAGARPSSSRRGRTRSAAQLFRRDAARAFAIP